MNNLRENEGSPLFLRSRLNIGFNETSRSTKSKAMAKPVHVREILKDIDLAWWPEFLMNQAHPPYDDDVDDFPTVDTGSRGSSTR